MQQSGDDGGFAAVRMPHYSYVADLTSLVRFHGWFSLCVRMMAERMRGSWDAGGERGRERCWAERSRGGVLESVRMAELCPTQRRKPVAGGAGWCGQGSGSAVFLVHAECLRRRQADQEGTASAGRLSIEDRRLSHGECERLVTGNTAPSS